MRVNGNLGQIPPEQRTYWQRFGTLLWGADVLQRMIDTGQRANIEGQLENEAQRYRLFGNQPDFQGWFANRPEEYAMYIAEYGGVPVNHGTPSHSVYDPTQSAEYLAMHQHAINAGTPMSAAWSGGVNQMLTTPTPVNLPGSAFTLGPVTPSTSGAIYYPPTTQPPPSAGGGAGGGSSGPAVVPFPDVGAGGYPGGSGDAGSGGAAAAPSALAPIAIAVILALAMGG